MDTIEVGKTSAKLSWGEVDYPEGVKEYEVYRDGESLGTRKGTSYSDSGLDPDTEYQYQVKTIGDNGLESDLSDKLSVTTEPDEDDEDGGED